MAEKWVILGAEVCGRCGSAAGQRRVCDRANALFFEVYTQALHDRPPANQLLPGVIEPWIEPAAELAEAKGVPRDTARSLARLGLAVTRGLLLDLLATRDRAAVDAAMEQWIALSTTFINAADSNPSATSAETL